MNVAFWNLNFEILNKNMMLLYAKWYIIYYLWTGIIDCKSCHTIKTFKLVKSFFSLHHLQVKFMFTHSRLSMDRGIQWKWPMSSSFCIHIRIYRYMHDKENIFASLVKSALNLYWLPLGEHFFGILSIILKIFH